MAAVPVRCRLRMYQVGFGDCFLLTFEYDQPLADQRSERHVLIDFGSTRLPGWKSLQRIAATIREHTAGQIDVVVVSHRHKDHLSAFGQSDLVGGLMADGYPKLVVRSWTERPEAKADAKGVAPLGRRSRGFVRQLREARDFAEALSSKLRGGASRSLAGEVYQLAVDQLNNAEAIRQLEAWGANGRDRYLCYGMDSGIEDLIPGLRVTVLGPPTVEQHPAVARQRSADKREFWMIYQGIASRFQPDKVIDEKAARSVDSVPDPADTTSEWAVAGQGASLSPQAEAPAPNVPVGPVGPVRWLTDRMVRQNLSAFLRIVTILDAALNNTSLILLIEVHGEGEPLRLLFPGDAQIENWEYALKHAPEKDRNLALLRDVDVYKVGHHGSRNATPRTLYNLWTEPATADRPLVALMSTKAGVHGKTVATRVPRGALVAALDTRTGERLYSTQGITAEEPFVELVADLSGVRDVAVRTLGSHRKTSQAASMSPAGADDEENDGG